MARPKKTAAKVTDVKKLKTYRTRTEETKEDVKKEEVKKVTLTPKLSPKGHMETVVSEEYYNACKQTLHFGGQRFVPGAIIPKELVSNLDFYLQGGHIASRRKLRTVRKT
jgi:hypothetical protein